MLRRAWKLLHKALIYPLPESCRLTPWCFVSDVIIILVLEYWFFLPPNPGMAVVLLGLVAIIISIKTCPSKMEKAIWIVLCTLLVLVEFRSIKLDRQINQDVQTLFQARERSSFQSVMNNESNHFKQMLEDTKAIIAGEHDLSRTPIQRVYETYEVAGELNNLARAISTENPDDKEGMLGHYLLAAQKQTNAGDLKGAKKTMQNFKEAKDRMWESWQKQLRRYLSDARARETELRLRLPDYEAAPPPNVAAFLRVGVLTRKPGVDFKNLEDTARYLRQLADDSKEVP